MHGKQPAALRHMLKGHLDQVKCVAVSIDDKLIASGSMDRMVMIWCASTGRLLHTIKDQSDVAPYVDFSSDGTLLYTRNKGGALMAWALHASSEMPTASWTLRDLKDCMYIVVSPDGKKVLGHTHKGHVLIWSIETGDGLLGYDLGHDQAVCAPCWSSDSRLVASAGCGNVPVVWDAATGEQVVTFAGSHQEGITCVALDKKLTFLVSFSLDKTVIVRKLHEGGDATVWHTLSGRAAGVLRVAVSHDDRYVASAASDGSMRV